MTGGRFQLTPQEQGAGFACRLGGIWYDGGNEACQPGTGNGQFSTLAKC
ncbi:hypothetical protein [Trichothermofontia sp.]